MPSVSWCEPPWRRDCETQPVTNTVFVVLSRYRRFCTVEFPHQVESVAGSPSETRNAGCGCQSRCVWWLAFFPSHLVQTNPPPFTDIFDVGVLATIAFPFPFLSVSVFLSFLLRSLPLFFSFSPSPFSTPSLPPPSHFLFPSLPHSIPFSFSLPLSLSLILPLARFLLFPSFSFPPLSLSLVTLLLNVRTRHVHMVLPILHLHRSFSKQTSCRAEATANTSANSLRSGDRFASWEGQGWNIAARCLTLNNLKLLTDSTT